LVWTTPTLSQKELLNVYVMITISGKLVLLVVALGLSAKGAVVVVVGFSTVSTNPNRHGSQSSSSKRDVSSSHSSSSSTKKIVDTSTLTLLEHVNLNVPSQEHVVPFYMDLLGCGLDPRKAMNLLPDAAKKTIWANCGASQFHLPHGETAQRISGGHIGLKYKSLDGLKRRLLLRQDDDDNLQYHFASYQIDIDPKSKKEMIKITDLYGNSFHCRSGDASNKPCQPIISSDETDEWGDNIATKYGKEASECLGIDYVEFQCPIGTAERIALFYDSVFDASVSCFDLGDGTQICMVAIGDIDDQGKPEQSLLFRETKEKIPPYDGHHIALYVGNSSADFEAAYRNADLSGIVWCNPRFSDKADTLEGARKWKQFRFKNIVDMETGETIFELEHEIRSIEHEAWLR
jgi:hypothetical protein